MWSNNCNVFCVNSICVLCLKTKVCAKKNIANHGELKESHFEISHSTSFQYPGAAKDCVLLNTLKTLFMLPRELLDLQGLQYYFPENFRCNLTYCESENFSDSSLHHILESETLGFLFCKKNSLTWAVTWEKLNFRKS